jgi:hypothetical protein
MMYEISKTDVLKTLLEESLRLPDGWKAEVYVTKDGMMEISRPMTSNSWMNDPEKIGEIQALSFGDVDGFYVRSDGQVEISEAGHTKGEYYDECKILPWKKAVQRLRQKAQEEDWEVAELADQIKRRSK